MKIRRTRLLVMSLALAASPASVFATNGMFMIGYGAKSGAMGGAAIANPQDSLAGAVNPATITEVGMRVDVGADVFLPNAKATIEIGQPSNFGTQAGQTTASSRANHFLIPAMGGVMPFKRNISFGFSAVGAGGGGTRYQTNFFNLDDADRSNDHETLGVSLMVMQMNPTVAYRLNSQNTLGASVVMSIAQFRAFGLGGKFNTFTDNAGGVATRGNDWSYGGGLRLGWLGKYFDDQLMVGLTGTTKVYMTRFKKYAGLFAQNGAMDTPANYGLGLSYKLTDKLTAAFDVTETLYRAVKSIGNPGPVPGGAPLLPDRSNALGATNGLGFGWNNQTVYKFGIAYAYDDRWTFRAGWNYGKSPVPEGNGALLFNILAPAVTQNHLTLGAGYNLDTNKEINVYYLHAFQYKEYGPTQILSPVEIGMSQNAVGAELSLKF